MKQRICILTGTRAEYGLMRKLMSAIRDHADFELQIIVTGSHLAAEFGNTYTEIVDDGFTINEKVHILMASDTATATAKSLGLAVMGIAEALERLDPSLLVLLGDRYEALAAAQAALLARVPIAHLHGGELTYGALDEAIRHAITKMSHLHFVSTEPYRQRVIQLGEHPNSVFNVGALGVENIKSTKLLSQAELEDNLNFKFGDRCLLVTYHPSTLGKRPAPDAMADLLTALDRVPDSKLLITYPNADTDGRQYIQMLRQYAAEQGERVHLTQSLGQTRYYSALSACAAVVGNSSSGIIEAPSFATPTVNIGDRQLGRVQSASVVNCDDDHQSITAAIEQALTPEFLTVAQQSSNPYEKTGTCQQILAQLLAFKPSNSLQKPFYDLPPNGNNP